MEADSQKCFEAGDKSPISQKNPERFSIKLSEHEKVVVFGQAETGPFERLTPVRCVEELFDSFGSPPEDSAGINLALQSLFFFKECFYFRVSSEGENLKEYYHGLHRLAKWDCPDFFCSLFLPGVSDPELIDHVSQKFGTHCLLCIDPRDYYDWKMS